MKKALSLFIAVVMLFALTLTAFAAEPGTITIDNAKEGQTYTIYRLLDLESYNTALGAYSYKANPAWEAWLRTQTDYITFDTQGYVTWNEHADVKAFAKAARAHAVEASIDNNGSKTATSSGRVEFTGLDLGYYLVDTTMGTICSLNTTDPTVTIKEKNTGTTSDKKVEEGAEFRSENDASIGDTVNFKSTITVEANAANETSTAGAQNYVYHDTMAAGLTFTEGSVKVTKNGDDDVVDATNYVVKTKTEGLTDDSCTFEIVFKQDFCDTLQKNDNIVITYSAVLNENAVIGNAGNTNTAWVTYGENHDMETTHAVTTTRTWSIDVFKYAKIHDVDTPLEGAKFQLKSGGTAITFTKLENPESDVPTYRVNKSGDVTEITTDRTGNFKIVGLDSGTYALEETAAPQGYNKLAEAITVKIANNGDVTYGKDNAPGQIRVLNKSGAELPETGGIGTVIFYILGGVLVIGAGVTLVVKRRMVCEK